jgi:hypothetical protein
LGEKLGELKWLVVYLCQAQEKEPLISSDADHVYYRKGAMAIYTLKDYIGEEALTKTLAKYLQ